LEVAERGSVFRLAVSFLTCDKRFPVQSF
jgi:hypothetical protein